MTNAAILGSFSDVSGSSLMFRNKIINGNFDIWQRTTSQTSNGYGSDDRWENGHSGSTKTASRQSFTLGQTDVPGSPTYFSRTIVTSVAGSGNYVAKVQRIEFVNTLSGQTATLSFWAKADASKNIAVELAQNFGTGGSPSSFNTFSVTTCALSSSWQKFTITVNVPSISGKTLGTNINDSLNLAFWFDSGSTFNSRTNSLGQQSGTFDIAQVQLEAGSVPTAFEMRPVGLELNLCQRYLFIYTEGSSVTVYAHALGSSADYALCYFIPTMRRVPDVEWGTTIGTITSTRASKHTVMAVITLSGGYGYLNPGQIFVASAEIN